MRLHRVLEDEEAGIPLRQRIWLDGRGAFRAIRVMMFLERQNGGDQLEAALR